MIDVFFGLYNPFFPRRKKSFTYVVYVYDNISLSKGNLRSMGEASKIKLKDTIFIIPMTNVLILSIPRTHAQNVYNKILEMKSTSVLNILTL